MPVKIMFATPPASKTRKIKKRLIYFASFPVLARDAYGSPKCDVCYPRRKHLIAMPMIRPE